MGQHWTDILEKENHSLKERIKELEEALETTLPETTLPERVCKTLEGLCMLEWTPKDQPFQDLVYKFCHISSGTCIPHEDWMRQFEETERFVNEALKAPGDPNTLNFVSS
jgi:hypothetical protein